MGKSLKIKFKNDSVKGLYEEKGGVKTEGSIGFDVLSIENIRIPHGEHVLIDTGIVVEPPAGYHIEVLPRSSMFKKTGLILSNGIGLIDSDYCGKDDYIKLPVANLLGKGVVLEVSEGQPLCQIVLRKSNIIKGYEEFEPGDENRGGFGSTDKKEK